MKRWRISMFQCCTFSISDAQQILANIVYDALQ